MYWSVKSSSLFFACGGKKGREGGKKEAGKDRLNSFPSFSNCCSRAKNDLTGERRGGN